MGALFSGLKCMGLPRANKMIRATLGNCAPAVSTVKNNVRKIKEDHTTHLCPMDTKGRVERAARLWGPIVKQKIEDGVLKTTDCVPVTCGCDATPVPAHPRFCDRRQIIVGLCGPVCPDHKCSLAKPAKISNGEEGFHQIVELVTKSVWASYVYVHILQPQVIIINLYYV